MAEPIVDVGSVVINVLDYEREKAFWGTLLGVGIARESAPWFLVFEPQHPGALAVALQAVETASEGPRRLHLDTTVADREAAKARIVELGGAHIADRQAGEFRWTVMADPEGNEFCIATAAHD